MQYNKRMLHKMLKKGYMPGMERKACKKIENESNNISNVVIVPE